MLNEEFLCDLEKGDYVGNISFELMAFDHRDFGGIYHLDLYEGDEYLTSYKYGDTVDAKEDMEEAANRFGVDFTEIEPGITANVIAHIK